MEPNHGDARTAEDPNEQTRNALRRKSTEQANNMHRRDVHGHADDSLLVRPQTRRQEPHGNMIQL